MNCSRTTQKSLSYGIIILVLFYIVIIFCWPEGVAYDVAQWLFIANRELLWTFVVLSEGPGTELPFGAPGIPQCIPWSPEYCSDGLRRCDLPWHSVGTLWFFFFYLIVKAPEYADDQVD